MCAGEPGNETRQGRQVIDLPALASVCQKSFNGTFSAGERLHQSAADTGGVNPPFGKVLLGKTLGTRLRRGGKAAGEPAQEPAAYRSSRK